MDYHAVFADLHAQAVALGGARLFTVTVQDRAAGLARRAYTSHPVEYPTSVAKPLTDDPWSKMVLGQGQTFVANSTPEFAIYFFDHALINALGCQAAINIPLVVQGAVLGTVNILDVAGHFTPSRVAALQDLLARNAVSLADAMRAVPMGDDPAEGALARLRVRMVEAGVDLLAVQAARFGAAKGMMLIGPRHAVLLGGAQETTVWQCRPLSDIAQVLLDFAPLSVISVETALPADARALLPALPHHPAAPLLAGLVAEA